MPTTVANKPLTKESSTRSHAKKQMGGATRVVRNGFHASSTPIFSAGEWVSSEEFLLHYAAHPDFNAEAERAQLAEQTALRYAAQLRVLGIEPDDHTA